MFGGVCRVVEPVKAVESVISRISRVSQQRQWNHFDNGKQSVKEVFIEAQLKYKL